jgi:beta-galactosidase
MVQLRNRRLLIDEKPVLVFAGEIHYFRLDRSEWRDRIEKAKAAGLNAVASYIPWLVHEPRRGEFVGLEEVAEFVDLCQEHGLWFIARPGPFVMAELKNEGIPFWVYRDIPEAVPVSWEGEPARSKTLDYLHPRYLDAVRAWYGAIMPVLAARLQPSGGPVIGVQLDNEIGMLSWVNNQPDLTDHVLADFGQWLGDRASQLPTDLSQLRTLPPEFAPAFHRLYNDYERSRFARYVAELRAMAEAQGIRDIPFIVNIHGCGNGRGQTFPIGIHQLFESYADDPGFLSGSDHYLGELDRSNAPDLYMLNAFMASVNHSDQPLSSMEFEAGTGDYGETGAVRQSQSSADFKARISVAQGNRLLNYYLLTGGINPPLSDAVGDGNDRIAFTGERHGFAAPISPEGHLDPTYHGLADTTRRLRAVEGWLADMDEEYDNVALGFIPDYYKTAYRRPGPMDDIVRALEDSRSSLDHLTRALLWLGFRFPAVNLQADLDPAKTTCIALACGSLLDETVQRRLLAFTQAGGRVLLYGDFPVRDMEGRPCTVLADALGVRAVGIETADHRYFVSVRADFEDSAAFTPEVRVARATIFEEVPSSFLRTTEGRVCGFRTDHFTVVGCNYPVHLDFFRRVLAGVGAVASAPWRPDERGGVFLTTCRNTRGEGFVTLLNLDSEAREVDWEKSPIHLGPRESRLLPLDLRFGNSILRWATTDIEAVDGDVVHFRRTLREEKVVWEREGGLIVETIPAGVGAFPIDASSA